MSTEWDIPKNKFASGLLCGAVASGVVAAASLGGVGTANATCVSFSGFSLGTGCTSSLGGFAIGIGDGTEATANGLLNFAIATGANTFATSVGALSLALAGGSGSQASTNGTLNLAVGGIGFPGALGIGTNVTAQAGSEGGGDFGNVAVNLGHADELGQSGVFAGGSPIGRGVLNLAVNLGGNADENGDLSMTASGIGNSAINVSGNRNQVVALGILSNATNLGNPFFFPNGSDNIVIAGDLAEPAGALLSVAFNVNGVNNTVNAFGPLSIAGALIVSDQEPITKEGPGITVRTPLNPNPAGGSVLAARGTQQSLVRPSLNFSPGNNAVSTSLGGSSSKATSPGGSAFKSASDRVTTSVKKLSDTVSKVTRGLAGGSKAAAAKTSSSDD